LDFGDATTSSLNQPSHIYSSPGNYNVSLTTTSANGCIASITKSITVYALPVADAGADQNICAGTSAMLTATGGVSYQWNPGAMSGASITVNPSVNKTYTVTVTDTNGCQQTDQVNIFILPLPVANAGADATVCYGLSATLHAS